MAGSIPGSERRIILVGKRDTGKSATVKTILGSKSFLFGWSLWPVKEACQKKEGLVKGRKVVVVDTPGLDCPLSNTAEEMSKCMTFCSPGPHAILHVSDIFRLPQEDTQQIKDIFGHKAKDYTIVLFTFKDILKHGSIEKHISSFSDQKLKKYVAECGNRYLGFDNEAIGSEREAQVAELMTMIDDLVEKNKGAPCYTEDMMNANKRHNSLSETKKSL